MVMPQPEGVSNNDRLRRSRLPTEGAAWRVAGAVMTASAGPYLLVDGDQERLDDKARDAAAAHGSPPA